METNSADISNQITEKENELANALENQQKVEQEILLLQRDILELQYKKKNLEITNSKAKHNIKQLNIEIKLLTSKFWLAKNSGL